jgi:hypothetical protein
MNTPDTKRLIRNQNARIKRIEQARAEHLKAIAEAKDEALREYLELPFCKIVHPMRFHEKSILAIPSLVYCVQGSGDLFVNVKSTQLHFVAKYPTVTRAIGIGHWHRLTHGPEILPLVTLPECFVNAYMDAIVENFALPF